jgi:ATP-dependent Lon protease
LLVPVLPLRDLCLFPGASLSLTLDHPAAHAALRVCEHTGGNLIALARREGTVGPRDLHGVGTIAAARRRASASPLEPHLDLDGFGRARVEQLVGTELLVAQVSPIEEGDAGEEWGPAVEALARYLHAHPELRDFLDRQRRSSAPMAWVNLACQHLPITASARQKLLEASAAERCSKISRGLDALLRKEQAG